MNGHWLDRMAALISVVLLGILAIGTYYLAEVAQRQAPLTPRPIAHEADYFVTGFALVKVNNKGDPIYRLTAKKMTHFPDTDTVEFDSPQTITLDPSKPTLTIVAKTGISKDTSNTGPELVTLNGDVRISRPADSQRGPLLIETQQLILNPDAQTAQTPLAVNIQSGSSTLKGVGMLFNQLTEQLSVFSKVQSTWAPRQ